MLILIALVAVVEDTTLGHQQLVDIFFEVAKVFQYLHMSVGENFAQILVVILLTRQQLILAL